MIRIEMLLFLSLPLVGFSQFANYTWVVGAKDVVKFDTVTKIPTTSARIANPDYTLEGVAVANNPSTGEIYFYHDGHQIFTKNYVPMVGGTDIGSKIQGSTAQGAAIYTLPDCTNKKFVAFSNDADHSVFPFKKGKLYYTIVDMTNGTGTIGSAKTLIRSDLDEGMIVINDFAAGKSWLVAKLMDENKFVSIPLTANPSDLTNTNNHIVSSFTTSSGEELKSVYTLSHNPITHQIAMGGFLPAASVAVINFNTITGQLTNFTYIDKQALNNQGNAQQSAIADVCWSPNGTKLYALTQKNLSLYQYDFSNGRARTLISQDPQSVDNGGMKIDPSGKIWVINNTLPVDPLNPIGSFNVSRIHNPNAPGGLCNFVLNDFTLLSNGYFYFPATAEYDPTPLVAQISTVSSQDNCAGDTVVLTSIGGQSWLWSNGSTAQSIAVINSGDFSVTTFSANGCSVTSSLRHFEFHPKPNVYAGSDAIVNCGSKVDLMASGTSGLSYQWLGSASSGSVYNQVGQGEYIVVGTENTFGCSNRDTVLVTEMNNNVEVQMISDTLVCKGNSLTIQPIVSGVSGIPLYGWSNGTSANSLQIQANVSMSYTVTVTDQSTSCSSSKTVLVRVDSLEAKLTASGELSFCQGDSVVLQAEPSDGTSYTWFSGNGSAGTSQTVYTAGMYQVEIHRGVCTALSNTLQVDVLPSPYADFNQIDELVKIGQEVSFTDLSYAPDSSVYNWSFGNQRTSTEENPFTSYENPGSYFISLTLTAPNGCSSSAFSSIDVGGLDGDLYLFLPSAFTPNGDGINDYYKAVGANIRSVEMFVHNRWGEILFYSPNQLVGWDGNDLNGAPVRDGYYAISVVVVGNNEESRKEGVLVYLYR